MFPPNREHPPYVPKVMNLSTRSTHLWLTTLSTVSYAAELSGTPIFTNHIRHREVTGRRYTGLLVTFSRPIESTCAPCTGPEEERGRPVLQATVGRFRLGLACHPRPVGAGASSALSRPSWAASLAHRPRSCGNQGHFVTPAASSVHEGDPMSSPRRLRHPRPCQRPGCRSRRRGASLQPSGAIWNGHSRTSGRWPGSCWPALYSVRGERSLLRAYVG